jgi:hypothetical protein
MEDQMLVTLLKETPVEMAVVIPRTVAKEEAETQEILQEENRVAAQYLKEWKCLEVPADKPDLREELMVAEVKEQDKWKDRQEDQEEEEVKEMEVLDKQKEDNSRDR